MKIQQSAENYLETIFVLTNRGGQVRSVDIANELGFSKPSVSVAMKSLRENGYIEVMGDGTIVLKKSGMEIAERLYDRHTVLTGMFKALGVSDEVASEDACKIEHIISEESFKAIKNKFKGL